jgi:hypothetical protein
MAFDFCHMAALSQREQFFLHYIRIKLHAQLTKSLMCSTSLLKCICLILARLAATSSALKTSGSSNSVLASLKIALVSETFSE